MTYLTFLILFVLAPSLVLLGFLLLAYRRAQAPCYSLQKHWVGTGILAAIALIWTTPWDNLIIARGVWSYGEDRVLATLGLVPIEEYAFMVLMPLFNAAIFGCLLLRGSIMPSNWRVPQWRDRILTLLSYGALWLAAFIFLQAETDYYLRAILLWFLPPLAIQAVFDPKALSGHWFLILVATLIPTAYFSLVDGYAIQNGIWTIHTATRTGLDLFGLPMEEALFFFTTSLLLARGLVLWHSLFTETKP